MNHRLLGRTGVSASQMCLSAMSSAPGSTPTATTSISTKPSPSWPRSRMASATTWRRAYATYARLSKDGPRSTKQRAHGDPQQPIRSSRSGVCRSSNAFEPAAVVVIPRAARRVHRDWAQLCAATPHPALFDTSMVAPLPEQTRRYLTHAISAGTPLWQSVEVAMVGEIKLGAWRPFTASQVVAPARGYIWAASTRLFGVLVIGYDRLSGGTAEMRWRLLDLLPVVTADGSDVARSAAGRLASEIALIPTTFPGATWTSGGPDTALASWGAGEDQHASSCTSARPVGWSTSSFNAGATRTGSRSAGTSFGVTVEEERTDAGVTTPAVFRAGWWRGTDHQDAGEFLRAQITNVTFR